MRLTFSFPARVLEWNSGNQVRAPAWLDGWRASDDQLENYFDNNLADAGVSGGEIWAFAQWNKVKIRVIYWVPKDVPNETVELLRDYTLGQLDDGIGEGGFECQMHGQRLTVIADTESKMNVELIEDGKTVSGPSRIAIAARDGDMSSLAAAIAIEKGEIDRLHQGHTGLHLAILYGHVEAALSLIDAGADPNRLAPIDDTPLELCALSNSLNDEQSLILAKALVDAGALVSHVGSTGESATTFAAMREKMQLAEFLKQCSRT